MNIPAGSHYTFNADGSVNAHSDFSTIHGAVAFPHMTWRRVGRNEFEIAFDYWENRPQVQRVTLQDNRLILSDGSTWITRVD